ncbi:MAG: hypothetical protein HQL80_09340 [Magnetococcales bacterium]|nr:hypothetical protein [Magnetococcales bacterium]MBF0584423.1 hypothetical protein [Magnetococcales bacterium]
MSAHRIHQIHLLFVPEEDRLLLRINTQSRTEFRFWLTRRFVKRLWPGLRQALEVSSGLQGKAAVDPLARAAVLDFMHQQAVAQTDFSTRFDAVARETPLGPLPVLVTRARIEPREQGGHMVSFHPQESYGIELAMAPKLLHSFCELLTDAVGKADWDLSMPLTTLANTGTPVDPGGLHNPAGGGYRIN